MLTRHHAPCSFSQRMLWLLEELGADYRIASVRCPAADVSGADPGNPHPHGYTPAPDHGGPMAHPATTPDAEDSVSRPSGPHRAALY